MNVFKKISEIDTFFLDVDGVLTDGSFQIAKDDFIRTMNANDGFALRFALIRNYRIVIITGAQSKSLEERLRKLGIEDIFMGIHRKGEVLQKYLDDHNIDASKCLYMGDDVLDISAMKLVGLRCCPKNAMHEVKAVCHYISHLRGGNGCVRDLIEKVLRSRNDWFS